METIVGELRRAQLKSARKTVAPAFWNHPMNLKRVLARERTIVFQSDIINDEVGTFTF